MKAIASKQQKIDVAEILRFLLNGGICAVSEFGMLVLLIEVFVVHYLTSNALAFLVVNILNYFLNRWWVFQAGKYPPLVEFLIFTLTVFAALAINQVLMWCFVALIGCDYLLAKVIATAVTVIWNFWSKKYLVFQR